MDKLERIEKFQEHLKKADSSLKTSDHLVYITFPLIKENRLLKKILEGLGEAAQNTVQAILEYETKYRRASIDKDGKVNFESFKRLTPKYNINAEEITLVENIFNLIEKYKQSPFEFIRKNKLVMMSENLKTESIHIDQLKQYLNQLKSVLFKAHAILDVKPVFSSKLS